MEAGHCCAFGFLCMLLSLVIFLQCPHVGRAEDARVNRKVGIQLLSYQNLGGQLPNGECCDGMSMNGAGSAPPCVPDTCDTVFVFCFTFPSNTSSCNPFFETTPLMDNNTVSSFEKNIDSSVTNSTSSQIVLPAFSMEHIRVELDVVEVDPPGRANSGHTLGNFSILINSTHLYTPDPDWQTFHFRNQLIEISLNVTAFCSPNYYSGNCSVQCDRHSNKYKCDNDGNKVCNRGYTGVNCTIITDHCFVLSPCKNGATCHNLTNDFACTCTTDFTGKTCETLITTTTAPVTSSAPSLVRTSSTKSPSPTKSTPSFSTAPPTTRITGSQLPPTSPFAEKSKAEDTSSGTSMGVIVGPLAAVLAIGAVATAIVLWVKRKRQRQVDPEPEKAEKEPVQESEEKLKAEETKSNGKPREAVIRESLEAF